LAGLPNDNLGTWFTSGILFNPAVVEALQTLVSVIARCGHTGHADFLQEALQQYESGSPVFNTTIARRQIWGGAGSVADQPIPRGTPDRPRFFQALIVLADYSNAQMIGAQMSGPKTIHYQAEWIASALRQWLAQGL
jgi:hypothetical protein